MQWRTRELSRGGANDGLRPCRYAHTVPRRPVRDRDRRRGQDLRIRRGRATAVDDCSLDINAGEICIIVAGRGKTTLLQYAIAGFHEITAFWAHLTAKCAAAWTNPRRSRALGPHRRIPREQRAILEYDDAVRSRLRLGLPRVAQDSPSRRMRPDVISWNPAIALNSVVLPHPDGPTIMQISPASMSSQQ